MHSRTLPHLILLTAAAIACNLGTSLSSGAGPATVGSMVISEVMPNAGEGQFAWMEILNTGEESVSLARGLLVNREGGRYTFPDDLPGTPAGAFIVVLFDGLGAEANDYDFGDDVATLHSDPDLIDPFDPAGDQLALFAVGDEGAETLLDFVAWGQRPEAEQQATAAGIWYPGAFVNYVRGGEIGASREVGVSLGQYPGQPREFLDTWVVYASRDASPGAPNGIPSTEVMIPGDGALLLAQDFRLAWYNVPFADRYRLQVDEAADFSSPEFDVTLTEAYFAPAVPPPDGTYFWRVQTVDIEGRQGPFSASSVFSVAAVEPLVLPSEPIEGEGAFSARRLSSGGSVALTSFSNTRSLQPASFWEVDYVNALFPFLQRKDSDLICWDNDAETGARRPWDGEHADTPGNHSLHGRNYCARASIAMINDFYGGDLTQDRITYEHFGGDAWPLGDLGHNQPLAIDAGRDLLSWSLNDAAVTLTMGKPTFAQIQGWAAEGRPVLAGIPGHAIVLRGWSIYNGTSPSIPRGTQFVIYNDPWDGRMHVERYSSLVLTNTRVPGGTPSGRMQEASVTDDADNDGIMSFDETKRFRTDPANADTDNDCINDKLDMHSYLYNPHDTYSGRSVDIDADGSWKQVDADNDNGGVIDGDEDANRNGHLDAGETDNFDASDDVRAGDCRPAAAATATPPGIALTTETPTVEPTEVALDGSYPAFIDVVSDPAKHDTDSVCYICMPRSMVLEISTGSVTVSGPAPWVEVTGELADDGSFSVSGRGTVAGFPNIAVTMQGSLTAAGLAADYTMGAEGSLPTGQAIIYRVEGQREQQPDEDVTAVEEFVATFNSSFEAGDVAGLMELLNPGVIERYGSAGCRAYLGQVIENPIQLEVISVYEFGEWNWERDDVSALIQNTYTVEVAVTSRGETTRSEIHFAVGPDGSLSWFADCGDPL